MKSVLKAPGSMLLKLRYDGPLSEFAFKFNLRRFSMGMAMMDFVVRECRAVVPRGRGLHSSTSQLNLSRF